MKIIPNFIGLNKNSLETNNTWTSVGYINPHFKINLEPFIIEHINNFHHKGYNLSYKLENIETNVYVNNLPTPQHNKLGYIRLSDFSYKKNFVYDYTKTLSSLIDLTGFKSKLVLFSSYEINSININNYELNYYYYYNDVELYDEYTGFIKYLYDGTRIEEPIPVIASDLNKDNFTPSYEALFTPIMLTIIENNLKLNNAKFNILLKHDDYFETNSVDTLNSFMDFFQQVIKAAEQLDLDMDTALLLGKIEEFVHMLLTLNRPDNNIKHEDYKQYNNEKYTDTERVCSFNMYLTNNIVYSNILGVFIAMNDKIQYESIISYLTYILAIIFMKLYKYDYIVTIYKENKIGKFILRAFIDSTLNTMIHGINPMYTLINRLNNKLLSNVININTADAYEFFYRFVKMYLFKDKFDHIMHRNILITNTFKDSYDNVDYSSPVISDLYMEGISITKFYNNLKTLEISFTYSHKNLLDDLLGTLDTENYKITDDIYELFSDIFNKLENYIETIMKGIIIENKNGLLFVDFEENKGYKIISPFEASNKIKFYADNLSEYYKILVKEIESNYYYTGYLFKVFEFDEKEYAEKISSIRNFLYRDIDGIEYIVDKQFIATNINRNDVFTQQSMNKVKIKPLTSGINRLEKTLYNYVFNIIRTGGLNLYNLNVFESEYDDTIKLFYDHNTLPLINPMTTYVDDTDRYDMVELCSPILESKYENYSNSLEQVDNIDLGPTNQPIYTARQHINNKSLLVTNVLLVYNMFDFLISNQNKRNCASSEILANIFIEEQCIKAYNTFNNVKDHIISKFGINEYVNNNEYPDQNTIIDIFDEIVNYLCEFDEKTKTIKLKSDYDSFLLFYNYWDDKIPSIYNLIDKSYNAARSNLSSNSMLREIKYIIVKAFDIKIGYYKRLPTTPTELLYMLYTMIMMRFSETFNKNNILSSYLLIQDSIDVDNINNFNNTNLTLVNIVKIMSLLKNTENQYVSLDKDFLDKFYKTCEIIANTNLKTIDELYNFNFRKLYSDVGGKLLLRLPIFNYAINLALIGNNLIKNNFKAVSKLFTISNALLSYLSLPDKEYKYFPYNNVDCSNFKDVFYAMKDLFTEITIYSTFMDVMSYIDNLFHNKSVISNIENNHKNLSRLVNNIEKKFLNKGR